MTLTVTDSTTHDVLTLPEDVTMYDIIIALKQLEANRRRFRKEVRGERKNYYVPTGNPRGRPRKNKDAPTPTPAPESSGA